MNSFLGLLAVQLPKAVTPTLAGLAVGAFVGVFGFLAVLFLVGRGQRRAYAARQAGPRVVIPPYGTLRRDTPLPQAAFVGPPPYAGHTEVLARHAMAPSGFRPSTDLSARAFAKMYAPDPEPSVELPPPALSSASVPIEPISVSAIMVIGESERSLRSSEPHPLSIIPSSSGISVAPMRSASFADLEMDDGQTEIAETLFDEPPQPRRRTDPPRIRPIAPSRPRFTGAPVPQPTPPPARVAASQRSLP